MAKEIESKETEGDIHTQLASYIEKGLNIDHGILPPFQVVYILIYTQIMVIADRSSFGHSSTFYLFLVFPLSMSDLYVHFQDIV